jgi:hypothetical protein
MLTFCIIIAQNKLAQDNSNKDYTGKQNNFYFCAELNHVDSFFYQARFLSHRQLQF